MHKRRVKSTTGAGHLGIGALMKEDGVGVGAMQIWAHHCRWHGERTM